MPLDAITGDGGLWRSPAGDLAQGLTGHLALQQDRWRWPPLFAGNLFWPRGVSVALTDSNPLFSLAAKLLATVGGGTHNLLGFWLAACWLLQPVAAVYALRAVDRSLAGAATVAVLAGLFPALLLRIGHVNLCGHFLILFALGLALRLCRAPSLGRWAAACGLLTVAILSHPYLFMISAAVLAAPAVQASLLRRPDWRRVWLGFLLASAVPVGVFAALAGTLGGGDKGFVVYSMNLLSPFWPQRSGLFGPDLPIIDATGGQYEGFNYLGAGTLLLLAAALPRAGRLGRWPGLALVLAALTLLALSSRVYAGSVELVDLGAKPWEDLFAPFRASGRAFWPVAYALVVGAVAASARLRPAVRLPLLAAAVLLQVVDTGPFRADAARVLAGRAGQAGTLPTLPDGATLLTVLPTPGCSADPDARALSNPILLAGIRAGMRLGDVGVGRTPSWFNCESILSDGLELPLLARETRVFASAVAREALRPDRLGPDALCIREAAVVVCGRGVAMPAGAALPGTGPSIPRLGPGSGLEGAGLGPVLGFGWREADGVAWSEGPRATLLFRPPDAPRGLTVALRLEGVAPRAGGVRTVRVSAGRTPLGALDLPDGEAREVSLAIPPEAYAGGAVRLAFDLFRPVDPRRRGLAAPVERAGLRLYALAIRPGPSP